MIVPAGFGLLLGNIVGLPAVCPFTTIPELVPILTMAVYFAVKAGHLPRSAAELCYIPNEISAPRERRFTAAISNENEACKASDELVDFCIKNGLDRKKSYYCGLCPEEVLVSAIQNRFNKKQIPWMFVLFLRTGNSI